jgi:hypothetical protein
MTATNTQLKRWADRLWKGHEHLKDQYPRAAIALAEIAREMEQNAKPSRQTFSPPDLKEWIAYAKTLEPYYDPLDAESAYDHYEAKGWRIGRDPMRDWKAACRQCHKRYIRDKPGVTTRNDASISSLRTRLKAFKDRNQGPHTVFWEFLSPAEVEECKKIIAKIKELEGK